MTDYGSIDPILLDFPESFDTERLTIRSPQWGDGADVNEAIQESVKELRPWLPFAENIPTLEDSEASVRKARLQFLERSDLMLHLRDKDTHEFVGSSGLHRMDWNARSFEIGYWVRTSRSGEGLVTEAVRGIEKFAIVHLQANRLEIRCDARNVRSASVAKRLGYTQEGILRRVKQDRTGAWVDMIIFSKVRGIEFD
ncbi:GNAT family N-acetyltransferase [Paenibacillus polysaccharolyticus]|uniref:GNAT family N-acetyltransferase n=1 Tax=Paenibacillus polysaccharolyticus TaxID=582692 RepID=UPI00203AA25B|nr:GNAT family N-acetyltransferase [Paenibacillus polysaccharolyticus]MCM3132226.1 GNAT family N-acetyltransferase [Paenibacillus polysaccharolyticus]